MARYCGPARVLSNQPIGDGLFQMALSLPPLFDSAGPGQFLHVRIRDAFEPFLRRPFSIYDVGPVPRRKEERRVSFLYDVVGRGTALLADMQPGATVDVLGPLGRAYADRPQAKVTLLVGGGIGIPPMYFLARRYMTRQSQARDERWYALLGARTKKKICSVADFERIGVTPVIATDDGTEGHKGFVTELMEHFVAVTRGFRWSIRMYGCGPEPMLEKMVAFAKREKVPCQISMERRMGCGMGACRACVCKVVDKEHPEGKVVASCREGPVFGADELAEGPWW